MPDRQRLLDRKILVDGQDLAVEEYRVGGFGKGNGHWRCEVQRRENGKCFAEAQHVVAPVFSFVQKAVIARSTCDEAIHSCFVAAWIASLSLAMTERYSRSVVAVRPLTQHLPQLRLGDLLQRRARHVIEEV